jgi:hypothetical protein
MHATSQFKPAADVTAHDGSALQPETDFFLPPPTQIGEVITAHSTLAAGKEPIPLPIRLAMFATAFLLPAAMIWWVFAEKHKEDVQNLVITGAVLVWVLALLLAIWLSRFRHTVSYTGKLGASRHTLKGGRSRSPRDEILLFPDAMELRSSELRQYYNGVYTGTSYDYKWNDASGRVIFRLKGSYRSEKGTPKTKDIYNFVRAAENAWSAHLAGSIDQQLKQNGWVQFNLTGPDFVRVGPGFFEFCLKGQVERVNADDLKKVSISQGHFSIQHKDARWFSREGKYDFDYKKVANAKLFLIAVDRLVGWRG